MVGIRDAKLSEKLQLDAELTQSKAVTHASPSGRSSQAATTTGKRRDS